MKRISALTTGPSIDPPSAWVDSEDRPQDLPKPGPCYTPGCEALTIFYRCEQCQAVSRG